MTFEGVEGAGKTTQIMLCAEHCRKLGLPVLVTREPGGTEVGEAIRDILLDPRTRGLCGWAELLLFNASRAQHIHEIIKPALAQAKVVLCDRYFDASVAYQGLARGLGPEETLGLCLEVVAGLVPERTFWLDLNPREAVMRARQRDSGNAHVDLGRFEGETLPFHEKVRDGYEWSARRDPERIIRIDATGTPQAVFRKLWPSLEELITGRVRHVQSTAG